MDYGHNCQQTQEIDENRVIELEQKLMEVWSQHNVEEYYQQIILGYLDRVAPHQLEYQIAKEIKATHQRSSYYFKLNYKLNQRQKTISNLQKLMGKFKYQTRNQLMQSISQQIKQLRDCNLYSAEIIIQMHRQYGQKSDNLSSQEHSILLNLDEQNIFLKQSFVRQYILFQSGYDPFFLYHYDMKSKKRPNTAHPEVDKIFNLNVSYACRLFKAKKQLLNFICSGKTNNQFQDQGLRKDSQRRPMKMKANFKQFFNNYEFISPQRNNESRKTSINFRTKPLSLQSAIQRDLMRNGVSPKKENFSNFRRKSLASDSLERQYARYDLRLDSIGTPLRKPSKYIDESKSDQKLKKLLTNSPIMLSNLNQNLYRIVPIKNIQRKDSQNNYVYEDNQNQSLPQSLNWIVRIQPISNKQIKIPQNVAEKNPKIQSPFYQQKTKNNSPKTYQQSDLQEKDQQSNQKNKKQAKPIQQAVTQKPKAQINQDNQKKQIKMRPGKYTFNELLKYLKDLKLKQQVKSSTIYSTKWQQSIAKFQSYFCQFICNNELKAVALCVKTVEGPYSIKLWASLEQCNLQLSKYLFQKYVQYIQKQTKQQQLLYNGFEIPELSNLNFVKNRQNIFVRKRVCKPNNKKESDFQLFLFLKCSNIVFNQQNSKANILYSQQIQSFSKEKTFILPSFGLIQKQQISSQLLLLIKISQNLKDIKTLNGLLQDENFDIYEQSSKLKIANINALRFSATTAFKSTFVAGQGFIRLTGIQIVKTQNQSIYKVACQKNNMFLYFGKGFSNCSKFVQGTQKDGNKTGEIDVKMFSKELYGRLPIQSVEGCYGNWQISLWWEDQLQGRVRHQMGQNQSFGLDSFFTGIQIEGQLVYAFQVNKDDFLL